MVKRVLKVDVMAFGAWSFAWWSATWFAWCPFSFWQLMPTHAHCSDQGGMVVGVLTLVTHN